MRRVNKQNWLMKLYNDNKLYVWFLIGIISFSGISIGIAMGNSNNKKVKLKEGENEIAYSDVKDVNTIPSKEKEEKTNVIEKTSETKKVETKKENKQEKIENIQNEEVIKELKFTMPLDGDIIKDFSDNTLIYSNTLEEWINHTGLDIFADDATPVKSIENGIVTEIKEDPRYGYTIIIDHGQGYKSIYCNLSTLDMVTLNKNVEKGQVISGVGNTALFEIKDKTHLHFELLKDGKVVNPLNYINKGE